MSKRFVPSARRHRMRTVGTMQPGKRIEGAILTERTHISIRVPPGEHRLPELADFAARCEDAGLDGIGVPDHHHIGRDAYMVLAAMAHTTDRLTLFPATSNVVTRHPMVIASLINSLAELAPGRVLLTCAPGFLSVEKTGEAMTPRAQLAETLPVLRELLNSGVSAYRGTELELLNRPDGGVRVVLLASGPKMLELAGEVADGVMMLVGLNPGSVEAARHHIRMGAERSGRDPASLQEIFIVPFGLGSLTEVRAWPQSWFRDGRQWLKYPSASNLTWLRYAGVDLDAEYDPTDISDETADRICHEFGLFGPPEHCAERLLQAREDIGLKRVFLFPAHTHANHYELPYREIEAFQDVIGPALKSAGA